MRNEIVNVDEIHIIHRGPMHYIELDDVRTDLSPIIDMILEKYSDLRTKGRGKELTATTVLNESTSTSSVSTPSSRRLGNVIQEQTSPEC